MIQEDGGGKREKFVIPLHILEREKETLMSNLKSRMRMQICKAEPLYKRSTMEHRHHKLCRKNS